MHEYEYPHPAVTADAVLFAMQDDRLQVLLIRRADDPYRGCWAFPGGFIDIDEDLDAAVARELREETGLEDIPLEQFHAFGAPGRDPRERVITIAYLGVVRRDGHAPVAGDDATEACWFDVAALPELAFDHADMAETALARLRERIELSDIATRFIGDSFTISDLQRVYEVIMDESLDAAAFRDWVLGQGWIESTGEYNEPD